MPIWGIIDSWFATEGTGVTLFLKGDTPTLLESFPLLRETLLRPRATKLLSGGEEYCSGSDILGVLGLAVIDSGILAFAGNEFLGV